jgi:hypothetical protein
MSFDLPYNCRTTPLAGTDRARSALRQLLGRFQGLLIGPLRVELGGAIDCGPVSFGPFAMAYVACRATA